MMRPLIVVSGWSRKVDGSEKSGVNAGYTRSVARAGGVPLVLTPAAGLAGVEPALARADGLILTGGSDIHPRHYGQAPSPHLGQVNEERDAFDLALAAAAAKLEIPVLGICRGCQVLNVALGGTLWQDLPTEHPGPVNHDPQGSRSARTHQVMLEAGSRLSAILGATEFRSNSIHHQAVRVTAPGLRTAAWASDGVIEAVEAADQRWLLGVQWHPEEFWGEPDSPDQRLFTSLIEAARRGAAVR